MDYHIAIYIGKGGSPLVKVALTPYNCATATIFVLFAFGTEDQTAQSVGVARPRSGSLI